MGRPDLHDETAAGGRHAAETFASEILAAAFDAFTLDRSREVAWMARAEVDLRLYRTLASRGAHGIVDRLERRQRRYGKKTRQRARMADRGAI
jgi:hypothetical protein